MTTGHAVVVGGSIAGLCAAQALRSAFTTVTILEADALPTRPEGRRGTPQAWHNHSLLAAGREAIETLFPGFTERLTASGGVDIDPGYDAANCLLNGWAGRSRTQFRMFCASRPMIEMTVRQYIAEDPGINLVEGARVTSLLTSGDRATGVAFRSPDGQNLELTADFVVDTAGRGSRATAWMKELGHEIDEMTLDAKVSYSSRWYRWPADAPWYRWLTTFPDPNPAAPKEHQYLCSIFPIEDNSFIAVMGSWGLDMPNDVPSYEAAARKTRTREFSRILEASEPLTDVHHTRSTRNIWRRFDRIANPPKRFLALGDAVCAFNPIYGQGMSCAASASVMLQRLIQNADPGSAQLPKAFYAEQAEFLKGAWTLALSRDGGYAQATGTEALPDGWRKRLLRKTTWPVFQFVADACWQEEHVDLHMNRVFNLQETVTDALRNPKVLLGLARFGVKNALGRSTMPTPLSPELPPSDRDFSAERDQAMGRAAGPRPHLLSGIR